ncbi:signal transduction histidine kinase/purine-cytosine permease-like protein/FixJ family two-component response regulator [Variovorax boronicumulans]|uniref:histidine kinase n=1 Tax=Variovorax boronicumulans TaxID=436515 RepID=A0AAW8DXT1_9BURK|nr:ATP-binding protein [Variovorax boronicumulans]MDP9878762.1 signal transduction histidine kinase/purine-cytosine permease-like protein/FixJ family two-component response regulator [Variovorax boronicumulans]MDP9924046.1 signal transduction histidine kinase/purine-cytosine permease-like protein/FixJ family two-component response regulator [Variovorax boronicumulans]
MNPADPPLLTDDAPQRIVKVRRDYNSWVASETLEDYALRYTPQRFRKWSEWRVANTAFGAASFLVLEAVGATLLVQYGFANAFWAILVTGLIIFLAGLPISVYAARYGVDMDLLTRGAGFGYIGSTLTSLIYASFTFIFFALEAAVMAYALELALGIPPVWGYLVCALVVIPLVTHGVSVISRLQLWTQPLWLLMLVVPFVFVLVRDPGAFAGITHYGGAKSGAQGFNLHLFGAALTVGIALITQMGEQADYLRFMPARTAGTARRWWAGVLAGGPGWVVLGVVKMLGGAALAYLAITHMVPVERAVDPNQMYLAAYEYVFPNYGWAVAATALFVVVSQLKINVTNAYAGSLAWSNFFSRVAHSHPGRVVWVVFNALIAFMLMEMNVFEALGDVLGLFANIAIAWMMAVVADLVVNKPLGLSPPGIEFKRAHLWDINPVGVGAMALASVLSITAHLGVFGPLAQAFSALIALGTALVASPLLAWATGGKYYLARTSDAGGSVLFAPAAGGRKVRWARVEPSPDEGGSYQRLKVQHCVICEREYEGPDMAHCPAYQGAICSLCCTLDARCGDLCKPHASLSAQWSAVLRWLLPRRSWRYLDTGLGHFLLLMLVIVPLLAVVFGVLYQQELRALSESALALAAQADVGGALVAVQQASLRSGFLKAYMALLVIAGIVAWWLVLAHQSRKVAQEESNRQTHLLVREIALHRETDRALQDAKQSAEEAREIAEHAKLAADQARRAADLANQAKSRYISAISHELRTPLNSILGYAQLMGEDHSVPPHRQQAVAVIKRGGEHLLSLIEGTLAIAHIEAGKLTLDARPMRFADAMRELADMFELQAAEKGLRFRFEAAGALPDVVRADEKRVSQILINLLGNAIKFTAAGQVTLRVAYAREFAAIEIEDTGPGMTAADIERIFEPFARGHAAVSSAPGAGLGLTIAKMLTDLMGGEMKVRSTPGEGSLFCVRLFLPRVHEAVAGTARVAPAPRARRGYEGARRRLLVVDNEEADRELLGHVLAPLGFELRSAASGHDALDLIAAGYRPDAMFVDLAMPGIDGWETIRRARKLGLAGASVAIVSANAFDKGLDNDVGIAPEDFFVKPVRHTELLDWLERRLALQWTDTAVRPAPAVAAPRAMQPPSLARLRALDEAVGLGYFRGIMNQLDDIDAAQPECAAWTEAQRALARQFQFEAMGRALAEAAEGAA